MSTKKILSITFMTLIFYNLFRFVGRNIFSQTNWWKGMNSDNWHHWQLGLLLIFAALVFLRKKLFLKDLFLAIGGGMVIDETMYAFYSLNSSFNHYSPLGIIFEFLTFIAFALIILRVRSKKLV